MNIALCLCTRNRPQDLAKALASVQNSTLSPSQIIVSDDSDPARESETGAVCAVYENVTYLRGPKRGLSANRNHCLAHLADEVEAVSFIDDDVTISPEFLGAGAKRLAEAPPKTIITGRECNNGQDVTPHNCSFWGHQEVTPKGPDDYHGIVINTTLFPVALFREVRFDEALRYGCEEADICAQAAAHGWHIRFCPDLVNVHTPSPINRAEYARVVEASRLYSTYKRYRWLEKKLVKSYVFAVSAPLHLAGSVLKSRRLQNLPVVISAVRTAMDYIRHQSRVTVPVAGVQLLQEDIQCHQ